jgi:hypothetical protein
MTKELHQREVNVGEKTKGKEIDVEQVPHRILHPRHTLGIPKKKLHVPCLAAVF